MGHNVLFVSMEMDILSITQRIGAMYAHTNITQLKQGQYSHWGKPSMYEKFVQGINGFSSEEGELYIVDGNLAASAEDVYLLADQLQCSEVVIDGAYLLRHANAKLDRYTRAAENAEIIKHASADLGMASYASWQFAKTAVKGKNKSKGEEAGLEDIGYTDVIPQVSTIVLGLFQDDGVETMLKRTVRVMKGRNGETGQFEINWLFDVMNFDQIVTTPEAIAAKPMQFI
jgi:hypothetical protein